MDPLHPWFEEGLQIVRKLWPDVPEGYVCPICARGFPRALAGQLTREHAPARGLGGTVIALTCRECNSNAGSVLEAEADKREQLLDFAAGTTRSPFRARLDAHGAIVRVEAERVGTSLKMIGGPNRDNPTDRYSVERAFDIGTDPNGSQLTFRLDFPPFSPRRADVAMLRSSFLVAFAKFGYSFALHRETAIVRRQILEPDREIISRFAVLAPNENTSARCLFIVREPEALASVVVQMGRHAVFLPSTGSGIDIYQEIASRTGPVGNLSGISVPWPTRPEYVLDRRDPN